MKSRAFSLIELIFIIAILAIISVVAVPNFKSAKDKADLVKVKSDIALIRNGIHEYKNKLLLSASDESLDTLEEGEDTLFDKVLSSPIIPAVSGKAGGWEKISNSKYKVWLDGESSLEFTYNSDDYTFDCDFSDDKCKELTQ